MNFLVERPSSARAEDTGSKPAAAKTATAHIPWRETWAGGEMQARSWSVYSGSTVALGHDIRTPGWRLRSGGGYGQYSYRKLVRGRNGPERIKFHGHKVFSEAMLGYHFNWDKLTLKTFAGVNFEQHIIDPRDPDNSVNEPSYGAKGALEAWYSVSNQHWIAADLSYATTFNTYRIGARSGYRMLPPLHIGLETRIEGNDEYLAARLGAFASLKVYDFDLSIGGGITGDRDMRTSPYVNISLFYQY